MRHASTCYMLYLWTEYGDWREVFANVEHSRLSSWYMPPDWKANPSQCPLLHGLIPRSVTRTYLPLSMRAPALRLATFNSPQLSHRHLRHPHTLYAIRLREDARITTGETPTGIGSTMCSEVRLICSWNCNIGAG